MKSSAQAKLIRFFANRYVRGVAVALLLIAVAVLLAQTFRRANRVDGYDFTSYLQSAEALLGGDSPYDTGSPFPYVYPMFLAFALIPLTFVPHGLANLIWFAAGVVALFLSVRIVLQLLRDRYGAAWHNSCLAPVAVVLLMLLGPIQNNLLNGQVNFIVLFLSVLFLKYLLDGRTSLASLSLAMAISIKIVPAVLLLFLLLERKRRAFALTILLTAVFCLVPIVRLGGSVFSLYGDYLRMFVLGAWTHTTTETGHAAYFSLHGLLSAAVPAITGSTGWQLGAAAAVAAVLGLVGLRGRVEQRDGREVWLFCLFLLAILLITPMSETHHLAFLIPVVAAAALATLFVSETSLVGPIGLVAFFVLLYLGKAFRGGPFGFLAIAVLFVTVCSFMFTAQRSEAITANSAD
jgi:alpha-1,2-mannosyltransferase